MADRPTPEEVLDSFFPPASSQMGWTPPATADILAALFDAGYRVMASDGLAEDWAQALTWQAQRDRAVRALAYELDCPCNTDFVVHEPEYLQHKAPLDEPWAQEVLDDA